MEKVARPFPEHFQRLRLPIALQVWSFPNRYYNKLHNSLLLDSSAEITSVQPLPPPPLPVALCNVQHEQLAAQLDGSDWQWERGRRAEGWGRKTLGQFLLNLSRTYNKLMPPYPFPRVNTLTIGQLTPSHPPSLALSPAQLSFSKLAAIPRGPNWNETYDINLYSHLCYVERIALFLAVYSRQVYIGIDIISCALSAVTCKGIAENSWKLLLVEYLMRCNC